MRRDVDLASLVAGVLLVVVGVVLLLDRTGSGVNLRFGALWPILAGVAGAVLLAAGLDDRRRGR